jgi:hypothetical protein
VADNTQESNFPVDLELPIGRGIERSLIDDLDRNLNLRLTVMRKLHFAGRPVAESLVADVWADQAWRRAGDCHSTDGENQGKKANGNANKKLVKKIFFVRGKMIYVIKVGRTER